MVDDSETAVSKRDTRLAALYQALQKHAHQDVAIDALAAASNYKAATLKTYLTKNKLAPHATFIPPNSCRIGTLDGFELGDLQRALTQRENRYTYEHLGVSELVSSLLDRSRTNAGLALELVNRPELANRIDAFVLLFMTAWEQLLKAELEHTDKGSVFTGATSAYGRQMTINITQAIERCFPERTNAVRRNLETLKEMRDGAAHLLVPEVTGIASRYFQAGVLNYIGRFQRLAREAPFRFEGTGLLTLGVAYASPRIDVLRARYGPNAEEVHALITRLEQDAESVGDREFAVSIQYTLVLEKKPGPDAVRLTSADEGVPLRVVKVPRDPKDVCPHTASRCAEILTARNGARWVSSDVARVAAYLRVKQSNNEHHYAHSHGSNQYHSYSDAFLDLVCSRLQQDPDLLSKARDTKGSKPGSTKK